VQRSTTKPTKLVFSLVISPTSTITFETMSAQQGWKDWILAGGGGVMALVLGNLLLSSRAHDIQLSRAEARLDSLQTAADKADKFSVRLEDKVDKNVQAVEEKIEALGREISEIRGLLNPLRVATSGHR
jgi:hypothetical protein